MPKNENSRGVKIVRIALILTQFLIIFSAAGLLALVNWIIPDSSSILKESVMFLIIATSVYLSRRPARMLFRDFIISNAIMLSGKVSGLTSVWARYTRISGMNMYLEDTPEYEDHFKDLIISTKKLHDSSIKALRNSSSVSKMHFAIDSEYTSYQVGCGEIVGIMWRTKREDYVTCEACRVYILDKKEYGIDRLE